MPKRDVAYMQGQQDLIVQAALECMIEKGVPETSLRDICKRAGVSIGAFYVHFSSREELILAACAYDSDVYAFDPLPDTWEEFASAIIAMFKYLRTPGQMRRLRLSLQFVADLAVADVVPSGLEALYQRRTTPLRELLAHLHERGEITLPLGLSATTTTVFNFLLGSNYVMVSSHGSKPVDRPEDILPSVALLVGRKTGD